MSLHVWHSWIEIEDYYSIAHFECITKIEILYH